MKHGSLGSIQVLQEMKQNYIFSQSLMSKAIFWEAYFYPGTTEYYEDVAVICFLPTPTGSFKIKDIEKFHYRDPI
jgi:hypothetical protein